MIEGAMSVDFPKLRRRTEAVRNIIDAGKQVHVTDPNGTDVTFSIDGCSAFSLDGYFHENYGFATLPPGESPTHPKEGTANGIIVIDVSMDSIGSLTEPIELELIDGFVENVSGGDEAAQLRQIFERSDANARNLAEFAVGTNSEARFIGNLAEDKKREGTIHFAVGDNESLGGSIASEIHFDGVLEHQRSESTIPSSSRTVGYELNSSDRESEHDGRQGPTVHPAMRDIIWEGMSKTISDRR
jgi:leucyl aminopeptidase (aminopeptidase T)